MARILTKLRIDEISSVDRGAGENCRVLLWKRDGNAPGTVERFPRGKLFNDVMLRKAENDDITDENQIDPNDTPTALLPKLSAMVAAMVRAEPSLTEEHALFHLLHSSHGRRLAEHLNNLTKRKDPPMNRTEELRDIAKAAGGMAAIAKNIIDRGSTTISEHEFSAALMEHAKAHKRDNESTFGAFSRLLENDIDLRKALGIVKGYAHTEPTSAEAGSTLISDDSAEAVRQLKEMANKQRRTFEQVFADPANKALTARTYTSAHRPTTSSTSGSELQRR
jgi:hypothetical protein